MPNKVHTLNAIGHFDIAGPDIEQLKTFYANVFGWTAESKGPGYALLNTPGETVKGAIVDADHSSFTVGVVVPSLDHTLSAAVASGGSIIMPKTDNGWIKKGQVSDPAGNIVTLIQG